MNFVHIFQYEKCNILNIKKVTFFVDSSIAGNIPKKGLIPGWREANNDIFSKREHGYMRAPQKDGRKNLHT